MLINHGAKQIQTKNWELVRTSYVHFGIGERHGHLSWYESIDPEPRQTTFGSIEFHRQLFGKEIIYVRSVFIFEKGPYIQVWWSENEADVCQINKIIKIDGTWYRVEPEKSLRIERCLMNNGEVWGIVVQVINRVSEKVEAEIRVDKHQ